MLRCTGGGRTFNKMGRLFASNSSVDSHGAAESDRSIVIRTDAFYEESALKRHYFYAMDLRGQLFVENVVRNIATSMKDAKFLDFMYKNLQLNRTGHHVDAPLVTFCGKEMNFVTPLDSYSVLVYKDLVRSNTGMGSYHLLYGGTLLQTFDPRKLAFCHETGRMYHEVIGHKHLSGTIEKPLYGLLNVTITTQHFSDQLVFGNGNNEPPDSSAEKLQLRWGPTEEHLFEIKSLSKS